jgi:hypothetical protein
MRTDLDGVAGVALAHWKEFVVARYVPGGTQPAIPAKGAWLDGHDLPWADGSIVIGALDRLQTRGHPASEPSERLPPMFEVVFAISVVTHVCASQIFAPGPQS